MISKYRKGDWVRFQSQGKLTIGCVEYVEEPVIGSDCVLITDSGSIHQSGVLEYRRQATKGDNNG